MRYLFVGAIIVVVLSAVAVAVITYSGYADLRAPRGKPKQALLTTHCSYV